MAAPRHLAKFPLEECKGWARFRACISQGYQQGGPKGNQAPEFVDGQASRREQSPNPYRRGRLSVAMIRELDIRDRGGDRTTETYETETTPIDKQS